MRRFLKGLLKLWVGIDGGESCDGVCCCEGGLCIRMGKDTIDEEGQHKGIERRLREDIFVGEADLDIACVWLRFVVVTHLGEEGGRLGD